MFNHRACPLRTLAAETLYTRAPFLSLLPLPRLACILLFEDSLVNSTGH